ncbi:glycosyltransferase family 4 protein [Pseudoroseomonas cervicalis]|uniref:glycosyltransferase family 4 protein n=1 Tax=Teichococcus cervicalis TaxID=204525 RepID=UPI00277FFD50|nr:glycosyltransferase family 4 protein [Pseudoroseomonas cervicalis]MDQ1077677.1 glycosyltransferase involved in cell wall biosynthesis [Pseudoroseomonas cervicalis]
MRIALIMSHADRSMGGATRELHFMRTLREQGAEVAVFRIHPGAETEQESFLGGSVTVTFTPEDKGAHPVPHHKISAAMVEALRGFAPDVVIFKGLSYAINAHVAEALGHGPAYGFIVGGSVTDPVLDRAAFVFGEYEEQLAEHFAGFAAMGTGFVLPKYIDLESTSPPEPPPPAEYDIANVGNFYEKRKNQRDLLRFVPEFRLLLAGGGRPDKAVFGAAEQSGRVHFPGRLDHAALFPLLHRSRIMVHTSTMDGLPRAMVEGMACGLPVIAYRGTVQGGLQHGVQGFLIAPEELEETVRRLLGDEALRQRMSQAAREHVERHHGVPAIRAAASRFLDFLQRTL